VTQISASEKRPSQAVLEQGATILINGPPTCQGAPWPDTSEAGVKEARSAWSPRESLSHVRSPVIMRHNAVVWSPW
jgi:hypothetical protein